MRIRTLVVRAVRDFFRDDMPTYAAALAYHFFFALFPFLLFILALLSFLDIPQLFDALLGEAERLLPEQAMTRVEEVVAEVRSRRRGGLLSVGILGTIWIISVGMRSTMNALNVAYDLEEERRVWKRYGLSILYTVVFAVLVVIATVLFVVGPQLTAWLADYVGLERAVLYGWAWLRIPAALLLVMAATSLVYYFAPNLEVRYQLVTPGSVVAVLLWAAMSVGFRYYVANFARYGVTYGSVGAVIVLLLYFFLSAAVLLLGGEINGVIRKRMREAGTGP